ncbi:cupredoxin domain-containing protein [Pseudoroseicyclus tamaricis]|uniref:Cupredoxin family copper-binding protein n=1 Tax=Pseudoroseicyclus tamaricis TaxID=2705421 RepID=A0A6B2K225_9RHOB|nr:cupredoxin family copper-binding protein [Pseudoroseicyclus tamaricis]NDV00466.1 cupredoxin family copper-binding protein [Pseudoroseicyclus tamaricis]
MTTRRAFLAQSALGAAALAGLPRAAFAAGHQVTIQDFAFSPADLTVAAGDTVTFTNNDGAPHTATADGGAFDSGRMTRGMMSAITFETPGTYPYHCDFHPNMTGTITVT